MVLVHPIDHQHSPLVRHTRRRLTHRGQSARPRGPPCAPHKRAPGPWPRPGQTGSSSKASVTHAAPHAESPSIEKEKKINAYELKRGRRLVSHSNSTSYLIHSAVWNMYSRSRNTPSFLLNALPKWTKLHSPIRHRSTEKSRCVPRSTNTHTVHTSTCSKETSLQDRIKRNIKYIKPYPSHISKIYTQNVFTCKK